MISFTEENYLKALLKLTEERKIKEAGTNEIAAMLSVTPATVNSMLKKLKEKKLINYIKYGKISLTSSGKKAALQTVRKHRLWETFLFQKLGFGWQEVHDIAEELEHIHSAKLIDHLDEYLGYPQVDPHGDPIPNKDGVIVESRKKDLTSAQTGVEYKIVGVRDDSSSFLHYADKVGVGIEATIKVLSVQDYDGTLDIEINNNTTNVSEKFAQNILIEHKNDPKG